MKTAIFEYGKQSLAEWIAQNGDCEKMILKGEVYPVLYEEKDYHFSMQILKPYFF